MKNNQSGVQFEDIEKVASGMLVHGTKPTVRSVISVTGGKTEVVSKYLRDFFAKRDLEVSKMSDEIGSSTIANLIASEIQDIVDRRTAQLLEINARQKEQIDEYVELLEESLNESDKIQSQAQLSIELAHKESAKKVEAMKEEIAKVTELANNKVKEAADIKLLSENRIKSEQEKSKALIEVANSRAEQATQETKMLRDQVKSLSIDEAKRDMEKAEFKNMKDELHKQQLAYADEKTSVVKLTAEKDAITKDINRLETDNSEYKRVEKEYMKSQTQLIELQKQISELNNRIVVSERERESLNRLVSAQGGDCKEG